MCIAQSRECLCVLYILERHGTNMKIADAKQA